MLEIKDKEKSALKAVELVRRNERLNKPISVRWERLHFEVS